VPRELTASATRDRSAFIMKRNELDTMIRENEEGIPLIKRDAMIRE
jgi:hypothetical protein